MKNTHWGDVVEKRTKSIGSLVVGIDPVYGEIPDFFKSSRNDLIGEAQSLGEYVEFVLESIKDHVGFVKFQSAFFESLGSIGIGVLANAIRCAKKHDLMVILDAKRGDINSTSVAYAKAYLTPFGYGSFSDLEVDCITINPFLGPDSVQPFLHCAREFGKGIFFLAKTSNPSAGWIQDFSKDGESVSDLIANQISEWAKDCIGNNGLSSIGAVVGATFPSDGVRLRELMPNSIFLAPGIGMQGGSSQDIKKMQTINGTGILVPVSRSITSTDDLSIDRNDYQSLLVNRIEAFKKAIL
jgi:orotidine-5'-phosphate decarboxylase